MRTTIDLDPEILRLLKLLQRREGKSLGQLVSELLARALSEEPASTVKVDLAWPVRSMGVRIDLDDKDTLHRALDQDAHA